MKKLISILLLVTVVVVCAAVLPVEAEAAEIVASGSASSISWALDNEGVLSINGTGDMPNWDISLRNGQYDYSKAAPWYDHSQSIKTVVIQDGITSIGDYAFYECHLTSVVIPNSVTSIGAWAFSESWLQSITIPNGVTGIGMHAFEGCTYLRSVTIPNSVTSISNCAFQKCGLTSITIPNSVTSIGVYAFSESSLRSITIPNSVTDIKELAFYRCANLKQVTYCGTEEQWRQISMGWHNVALISATRSYHNWNISSCTELKSCTTCGEIATEHAWTGATCTSPTTCSLCGITEGSIYHYVYGGICTICQRDGTCGENLTWALDDEGTLTIFGTGAMMDYGWVGAEDDWVDSPWQDVVDDIKAVVIKKGVTTIGSYAFYNLTGLTSVAIENGLISIGEYAFENCTNLTNIVIPNSVTSIGGNAFGVCTSLSSITIPNSVTSIGSCAFLRCTSLTSVTIPSSITSIEYGVFQGCTSLTSVTIPNGVTSIGGNAFGVCTSLSSITIPNSVTSIYFDAFRGCSSLTKVIYCCSEKQWNQITINSGNEYLSNATRKYHHGTADTVTKLPTYTSMGEKVGYCDICGEQFTESIPARFYGTSVNLGNTLDMYFGFYTGLVDEGGKVVFVREFADGTTETTEAPITSFKKNNSVYDITYTGLAAKEMCDTIHITVYNGAGEIVGMHSDSIRSYILRQLREKDHEAAFRTLCIDLLNYGAAAQKSFHYNVYDLANKDLTVEELAEGTNTTAEYKNLQTVSGATECYYGTAYILETKISMIMAVQADYFDEGCYALVSYTDHTGTEKNNIRLEGKKNNSVYEFVLNEIVVADGRCLLTIEFYKADGTKIVTVQDSMESYTARNAEDYPLAKKMLAFSDAAYKYLHRND